MALLSGCNLLNGLISKGKEQRWKGEDRDGGDFFWGLALITGKCFSVCTTLVLIEQ